MTHWRSSIALNCSGATAIGFPCRRPQTRWCGSTTIGTIIFSTTSQASRLQRRLQRRPRLQRSERRHNPLHSTRTAIVIWQRKESTAPGFPSPTKRSGVVGRGVERLCPTPRKNEQELQRSRSGSSRCSCVFQNIEADVAIDQVDQPALVERHVVALRRAPAC